MTQINITKFVQISNQISYKRISKLEVALSNLNVAIESGEVVKTMFDQIKNELNSFVEANYEVIAKEFLYCGNYKSLPEDLQDIGYIHEVRLINSFSKKISKVSSESKLTQYFITLQKFVSDFSELYVGLELIKSNVVSSRDKKKEEAQAAKSEEDSFMKKYVSHKDVSNVIQILTNLTSEKREEIFMNEYEFFINTCKRVVDSVNSLETKNYSSIKKLFKDDQFSMFVFSRICDTKGNLRVNIDQFCKDSANEAANMLIDGFIHKTTSKIAFIIFSKNNMKSGTISSINISRGKVECDVNVKFNDNSRFIMNSSVVYASSKLGNLFCRYPTTFHDVVLPNGTCMKYPSEQKMEEIFVIS